MSLYSSFQNAVQDWLMARRAAETEAVLGSLPFDIRKDIGWPTERGRLHHHASPVRTAAAR